MNIETNQTTTEAQGADIVVTEERDSTVAAFALEAATFNGRSI